MAIHTTCDGIRRRDFIRAGAIGTSSITLANWLRWSQAAETRKADAKAAIFVNLAGGPSHLDTFDPKPDAPDEYRGEFGTISTAVPGIHVSEHLPKLAACMDKFVILRGITHSLAAHELGSQYVNTGNRPIPSLEFPGYGAVVTKELGGPRDLPLNVAIPRTPQGGGYLGVRYSALSTGSTPQAGQPYAVRGISLGAGLTVTDVRRRQRLLEDLDTVFTGLERTSQLMDGLDRFSAQAHTIITSPRAREAFNTGLESPAFAEPFGDSGFGQSCLLAIRLIEAGVPFVSIQSGGWDTHNDNWNNLETKLLPPLDTGLAALFTGLEQRGLLDSTTVFVTGEFGRTPKINKERVGRDHYARAMFMLLAGGGIRGGQVIGETDATGASPVGPARSPDDVAATFYRTLGIDSRKEYHTSTGRPVMIVRDGTPIPELVG
jgi:uncharacterized protein (DUF1501 family)